MKQAQVYLIIGILYGIWSSIMGLAENEVGVAFTLFWMVASLVYALVLAHRGE